MDYWPTNTLKKVELQLQDAYHDFIINSQLLEFFCDSDKIIELADELEKVAVEINNKAELALVYIEEIYEELHDLYGKEKFLSSDDIRFNELQQKVVDIFKEYEALNTANYKIASPILRSFIYESKRYLKSKNSSFN